jgi:hypothetical protein
MVWVCKASLPLALLAGWSLGVVPPAKGDTILSPSGTFRVGIDRLGNLFDPTATVPGPDPVGGPGLGFRRLSDGFDPIKPGTPIEGWGIAAGRVAGFVDPQLLGISNIVASGPANFTANAASISAFLNAGSGNLLRIDQAFGFVADNVLKIATTIANVSSSSQTVLFRRTVDWKLAPPPLFFSELLTVPPLTPPITGAGFGALENPNPLAPFFLSVPPSGGTFGPGDQGAALQFTLGTLAPGATAVFNLFEAISQVGQSEASLRSQVQGLAGPTGFVITGVGTASALPGPFNSAALGVQVSVTPTALAEPSTLTLLSVGLLGLLSYGCHRRLRGVKA